MMLIPNNNLVWWMGTVDCGRAAIWWFIESTLSAFRLERTFADSLPGALPVALLASESPAATHHGHIGVYSDR
jgi:hypothetical protein